MSLENEIKEAFTRHEGDVLPQAAAWRDVERRIGRSHRKRVAAAGIGAALAIAGAFIAVPRIFFREAALPVTSGLNLFRSSEAGRQFSYPEGWTIAETGPYLVDVYPPGPPRGAKGTVAFHLYSTLEPERYDADPGVKDTRGEIDGRRFIRTQFNLVATSAPEDIPRVTIDYRIDWPAPLSACPVPSATCPPYTLVVSIRSATNDLWQQYGQTAEQIVQTMRPVASASKTEPRVIGKIPVPGFPHRLVAASGSLWVLVDNSPGQNSKVENQLVRIDPTTKKIVARINVGYEPTDVAGDDTSIWVTNAAMCSPVVECISPTPPAGRFPQQSSVMRVDPSTNRVVASIRVYDPGDVALGFGSVWVTATAGSNGSQLLRIDPASNKIVATIDLGSRFDPKIAIGERHVWLTTLDAREMESELLRVDPATNRLTSLHKRNNVASHFNIQPSLTAGRDAVWVTSVSDDGSIGIDRIDPKSGDIVGRIELSSEPLIVERLTQGEGYLWAADVGGRLWKIDTAKNRIVGRPTKIGEGTNPFASDVVTGFGYVWVPSVNNHNIWQLTP